MADIVAKTERCLRLLQMLGDALADASAVENWAEDQQLRLRLWASKLGVFANERLSITYRLRRNSAVTQAISQVLDGLLATLVAGSGDTEIFVHERENVIVPGQQDHDGDDSTRNAEADEEHWIQVQPEDNISLASSSSSEQEDESRSQEYISAAVSNNISTLLRFASLIRHQSTSRTLQGGESYEPPPNESDSSDSDGSDSRPSGDGRSAHRGKLLSSRFEAHASLVLTREFGPTRAEDPSVRALKDRILSTMITRWRRVCYRQARGAMLAGTAMNEQLQASNVTVSKNVGSTPEAEKPLRDENIVSNPKNSGTNVQGPQSSIVATTLPSEFSFTGQVYTKTNSQKSKSRIGNNDHSLPPIPPLHFIGDCYAYDCPYCGTLPRTSKAMDRHAWKSHLWRDIAPYICVDGQCDASNAGFTSADAWLEHMNGVHWKPTFVCPRCPGLGHQGVSYSTESELQEHLKTTHGNELSELEMPLIAKFSCCQFKLECCLICGLEQGLLPSGSKDAGPEEPQERQSNIRKCISTHLEALALSSLPWHLGTKFEAHSNTAQGTEGASQHAVSENTSPKFDPIDYPEQSVSVSNLKHHVDAQPAIPLEDVVDAWKQPLSPPSPIFSDDIWDTEETPLPPRPANALHRGEKRESSLDDEMYFPKQPSATTESSSPPRLASRDSEYPVREPRNPPPLEELVSAPTSEYEDSKNFYALKSRFAQTPRPSDSRIDSIDTMAGRTIDGNISDSSQDSLRVQTDSGGRRSGVPIVDEDAYSYTDAASMYRDTEPRWRRMYDGARAASPAERPARSRSAGNDGLERARRLGEPALQRIPKLYRGVEAPRILTSTTDSNDRGAPQDPAPSARAPSDDLHDREREILSNQAKATGVRWSEEPAYLEGDDDDKSRLTSQERHPNEPMPRSHPLESPPVGSRYHSYDAGNEADASDNDGYTSDSSDASAGRAQGSVPKGIPHSEAHSLRDEAPRSILKKPTSQFPEDEKPVREGVAPPKDAKFAEAVPPWARWTKIDRRLVSPEALEAAYERFEERLDCVIVLRVLTKSEIQKLAERTQEIREQRFREGSEWEAEQRTIERLSGRREQRATAPTKTTTTPYYEGIDEPQNLSMADDDSSDDSNHGGAPSTKNTKDASTTSREYPCTFEGCTRSFNRESDRRKHEKNHSEEWYVCDECQKGFPFPKDLRRHMLVHSE